MRRVIFFMMYLGGIIVAEAQQQVTYTQYMFNNLFINPAYAGTDKYLNITAQQRKQWSGFKGSPGSQVFSLHTPLKNHKKIGLGVLLERQTMGVTELYRGYAMYAYRLKFRKATLSMGLQAGVTTYREELTDLVQAPGTNDPNFGDDITYTTPNFGAGVYYYNKNFYVGLSIPSLAQNLLGRGRDILLTESRHYFLTGGLLVDINESIKLKPNFLLRAVKGAPVNLDMNLNFLIKNTVWIGCSYRWENSVSAMLEVQLTPKIRMGLSYDVPVSAINQSDFHSGSPEGMLNYRAVKMLPHTVISPRYF